MWSGIKSKTKSFFDAVSKGNEIFFFVLFSIYVISNVILLINWKRDLFHYAWQAHFVMFAMVMWGGSVYLFSIIAEWRNAWKRTGELILIGIMVFLLAGIASKYVTTDSYAFIIGAFFCLVACGKNYRKILWTFLIVILAALLIAWIGLKLNITMDGAKPHRAYGGHSLGIMYPNDWGYFVLLS